MLPAPTSPPWHCVPLIIAVHSVKIRIVFQFRQRNHRQGLLYLCNRSVGKREYIGQKRQEDECNYPEHPDLIQPMLPPQVGCLPIGRLMVRLACRKRALQLDGTAVALSGKYGKN